MRRLPAGGRHIVAHELDDDRPRGRQGRHLEERLRAASPYSILDRGYAMVTDAGGRVVQRAGALAAGDDLTIRFARGRAGARVTSIEDEEEG